VANYQSVDGLTKVKTAITSVLLRLNLPSVMLAKRTDKFEERF